MTADAAMIVLSGSAESRMANAPTEVEALKRRSSHHHREKVA